MELKKYRLGELIDVTRGTSLGGEHYATKGDYIRLTCGNFDYRNNCFKENDSKENIYYTGDFKEEFLLDKGDIITPLTEQAIGLLGSTARIPESGKYIQSQDIAKITCKENLLDKEYAFYLISSKVVKQQLSAAAQQTKIRHTSPDKIKACTVWIPSLSSQRKIAGVLSALDQKIALNRTINQSLEQLAKTIYTYYFLQFHNAKALTYNPTLKKMLPTGWEVKTLGEIIDIKSGFPFKSDTYLSEGKYSIITIKNVQDGYLDINDTECINDLPIRLPDYCRLQKGDILLSLTGNVGRTCRVFADNLLLNQRVGLVRSKIGFESWVYMLISNEQTRLQIENLGVGSAQANVSPIQIGKINVLLPTNEELAQFEQLVKPILEKILHNQTEITALTTYRDALLPVLMNGQVEIE